MTKIYQDATVNVPGLSGYKLLNNRQTMFLGYMMFILIDLVVLNLFVEFWHRVFIDSFIISLLTACLLQTLLKITLNIEHRIATYFKTKPGTGAKVMRWFFAWVVMFGSKFVMLGDVDLVFGDNVDFGGTIPFIAVAFAIIITELIITRIYYSLADAGPSSAL